MKGSMFFADIKMLSGGAESPQSFLFVCFDFSSFLKSGCWSLPANGTYQDKPPGSWGFPTSWLKPRMIKQESHWTWKKFLSHPHQPALHYCSGRPSNFPQNIWNLRWVTHSQALFQAALYRLRGVFLGFVEFWLTKEAELLNSAETFLAEQSGDARGLLQSCLRT